MAFKDQSTIPKASFIEIGVYTFLLNRCIHTFIEIGVYTRIAHLSLKVRLGQPCVELHNGAVLRLLPPFLFHDYNAMNLCRELGTTPLQPVP